MKVVSLTVVGWPPQKSEAKSSFSKGNPNRDCVANLLRSVKQPLGDSKWNQTTKRIVGLELVVLASGPDKTPGGATIRLNPDEVASYMLRGLHSRTGYTAQTRRSWAYCHRGLAYDKTYWTSRSQICARLSVSNQRSRFESSRWDRLGYRATCHSNMVLSTVSLGPP